MNGFFVAFGDAQIDARAAVEHSPAGALVEEHRGAGFRAVRATLPKFADQKPFGEDAGLFVAIEGVLMNARALLAELGAEGVGDLCRALYRRDGDKFHLAFEGDYSGLVYDIAERRGIAFTNRTGTRPLFYADHGGSVFVGSSIKAILGALRAARTNPGWDRSAAYSLLSCGGMLGDGTLVDRIKRLQPGCAAIVDARAGSLTTRRYHQFANDPDRGLSEDDAIEGLEERFARAVKLGYEKDLEGGHRHVGSLSGGLDSRMTIFMARKLGYDTTLVNLGHRGCLDQTIALRIAHDFRQELVYYHLAGGNYLSDGVGKAIVANEGQVLGYGAAHVLKCYEMLDFSRFGLLHTGQIGDAIAGGSFLKRDHHAPADPRQGFYSLRLYDRVRQEAEEVAAGFANEEMYKLYVRAFQVANNGYVITDRFTPTWSPFLETEFLTFAYRIPPEMRFGSKIYHRWIRRHHPEAAGYPWASIAGSIRRRNWRLRGRPISQWRQMVSKRLRMALRMRYDHMLGTNPFDYWWRTNPELRASLEDQWQSASERAVGLGIDDDLHAECGRLYREGNCQEKLQGLTLLKAIDFLGDGSR